MLDAIDPFVMKEKFDFGNMARRLTAQAGDRLLLLEPLPYDEITGSRFFEILLDSSRWPDHVRTAYEHTKAKLASFRGG